MVACCTRYISDVPWVLWLGAALLGGRGSQSQGDFRLDLIVP